MTAQAGREIAFSLEKKKEDQIVIYLISLLRPACPAFSSGWILA